MSAAFPVRGSPAETSHWATNQRRDQYFEQQRQSVPQQQTQGGMSAYQEAVSATPNSMSCWDSAQQQSSPFPQATNNAPMAIATTRGNEGSQERGAPPPSGNANGLRPARGDMDAPSWRRGPQLPSDYGGGQQGGYHHNNNHHHRGGGRGGLLRAGSGKHHNGFVSSAGGPGGYSGGANIGSQQQPLSNQSSMTSNGGPQLVNGKFFMGMDSNNRDSNNVGNGFHQHHRAASVGYRGGGRGATLRSVGTIGNNGASQYPGVIPVTASSIVDAGLAKRPPMVPGAASSSSRSSFRSDDRSSHDASSGEARFCPSQLLEWLHERSKSILAEYRMQQSFRRSTGAGTGEDDTSATGAAATPSDRKSSSSSTATTASSSSHGATNTPSGESYGGASSTSSSTSHAIKMFELFPHPPVHPTKEDFLLQLQQAVAQYTASVGGSSASGSFSYPIVASAASSGEKSTAASRRGQIENKADR